MSELDRAEAQAKIFNACVFRRLFGLRGNPGREPATKAEAAHSQLYDAI
jgi:hypothetical protein